MQRQHEQPSNFMAGIIGGVITLAVIIGVVVGCRAMIASSDRYLEECSREAAEEVLERYPLADVEGIERGDYDDVLSEACYGEER